MEIDYDHQDDGFGHYDTVSFDLTIPAEVTGYCGLSARIDYQFDTRQYVEHLSTANVTGSERTRSVVELQGESCRQTHFHGSFRRHDCLRGAGTNGSVCRDDNRLVVKDLQYEAQ